LHGHDPVKPSWLHDDSELKALGPAQANLHKDILEEIKWNDEHRDHTKEGLTKEERLEISLFHSLK
jgi:hypothetical protein